MTDRPSRLTRNDEGGIVLTDNEREVLAHHIAAQHLSDDCSGPEWEDYPELAESEWPLVVDEINKISKRWSPLWSGCLIRSALMSFPHLDGDYLMREVQG